MTRRILVTRPERQAPQLARLLVERRLVPVAIPAVSIARAPVAELDAMLDGLAGAAWLVITSANGAVVLADRLDAKGRGIPPGVRVAAVGPATAQALSARGIAVHHVPGEYRTEAIAAGIGDVRGRRVVLARADAATPELTQRLREAGAQVEEVTAYRVVEAPPASRDGLRAALHRGLDGIAFTSGSTVRGVMRLASVIDRRRLSALPAFCIGQPTADIARRHGFDVPVVAPVHTSLGLADSIASYFARKES